MAELRATARLQLHRGFALAAAAAQVPYYAALGVSHLYLSPIATARAGSMHGYDVIDPQHVNPELGGEPALHALADALHSHGMGMIVDIVPNHMAADTANRWWRDVLAHGQRSAYAGFFDIDWSAPETDERLWLPILGQPLAGAIAAGEIAIAIDTYDGLPGLACAGRVWPMSPSSLLLLAAELGIEAAVDPLDPAMWRGLGDFAVSRERLAELIARQPYRLAHWRSGNDVVNYRRFFDITELVALAVERPCVFEVVHALPLRLISQGLVDGLRIDHVDGLTDPRGYLRRLRRAMGRAAAGRSPENHGCVSLHVEKILASGETLRADWPVDGSTGYDFMDQASAVLHDPRGASILRQAWHDVSGRPADFEVEETVARAELIDTGLQAEFAACGRAWHALAQTRAATRDLFSLHAIAGALAELLRQLRVYRSYLGPGAATDADRRTLTHAFDGADRHGDPDRREARDFLRHALLDTAPRRTPPGQARTALRLAYRRFEQLAAPLNAKSVEDTGFYRHGVLLSRNEVGSDPRMFSMSPAMFHRNMQLRTDGWPRAWLALATHDHKRGPDTRARLAVLGERAGAFVAQAQRWVDRLHAHHTLPAAGDLWMLLQTVLAAWPLGLAPHDGDGMRDFAERMAAWQLKALREAKLATRWTAIDEIYEAACASLLHELLLGNELAALRAELADAARSLDVPGALNGLAMATLQLTAPGVPDLYQGSEWWDQSLVDPDNRRPVDYDRRRAALSQQADTTELLRDFRDGRIKQWLTMRLLHDRHRHPDVLLRGSYAPLAVHGAAADRVLAFMRRGSQGKACAVVVPRLCADWLADQAYPHVPATRWGDTQIIWPDDTASTCRDVFNGRTLPIVQGALRLDAALASWPVAVLHVA
jgi:(1->4)-alpha-D-glucan 1-alpha-D-glucosylmutase